jgi:hypothetical protein
MVVNVPNLRWSGIALLLAAGLCGCASSTNDRAGTMPTSVTTRESAITGTTADGTANISPSTIATTTHQAAHLPPLRFTFADWFSPEYHGLSNTQGNTVLFRAFVPWSVADVPQLARLSVPFATRSAGDTSDQLLTETPSGPSGLGDIELYDISELKTSWGEFQIGPVFTFPTGSRSGVGAGKWTIGPALGANTRINDFELGIFSQAYFSFAGDSSTSNVSKVKLQPILSYSLPYGWDIGTSDMNFTYDWISHRTTNVPLGIQIGKRFELFSQKLKLSAQTEYNFANTSGTSAWTFRLTVEYSLPG